MSGARMGEECEMVQPGGLVPILGLHRLSERARGTPSRVAP